MGEAARTRIVIESEDFPRLTASNHRVTSDATTDYNCVAWAVADTKHWWQPGFYWPVEVADDEYGIAALERAFAALGYMDCVENESLEVGFEKVALYGSNLVYTHAAKQLPSGKWTSKLGRDVDIEHDRPDNVAGGVYGEVVQLMKRARTDT